MTSSSAPRVLVVEHEGDVGVAAVGERLVAAGAELVTVGPSRSVPVPDSLEGYDGLIVLGGTMSPWEDEQHPHLPGVRELVRVAVESRLPYLGICLGGQLTTSSLGGSVARSATPEIGCYRVQLSAAGREDRVFGALPDGMPVLQWHFLEMVDLPQGAVVLASSDRCAHQLYRLGDRAWATQFHLEGTPALAADWARGNEADVLAHGPGDACTAQPAPGDAEGASAAFLDAMRDHEAYMREHWGGVVDRWLEVVEEARGR